MWLTHCKSSWFVSFFCSRSTYSSPVDFVFTADDFNRCFQRGACPTRRAFNGSAMWSLGWRSRSFQRPWRTRSLELFWGLFGKKTPGLAHLVSLKRDLLFWLGPLALLMRAFLSCFFWYFSFFFVFSNWSCQFNLRDNVLVFFETQLLGESGAVVQLLREILPSHIGLDQPLVLKPTVWQEAYYLGFNCQPPLGMIWDYLGKGMARLQSTK